MGPRPDLIVKEAEFLFGSPSAEVSRRQNLPEIAVIGRSNVGKSSFINRIAGRQLARVSSTPGCTRQLNFYRMVGEFRSDPFALTLVDMPGFGFAKLSKAEREQISRLTVEYIHDREQLKVVVLLNDCRRLPEEDERAVQRLCSEVSVGCLIVVTKTDVLKASEKRRSLAELAKAYNLEDGDIVPTGKDVSPDLIWERVLGFI